jgi:hypothetical protein
VFDHRKSIISLILHDKAQAGNQIYRAPDYGSINLPVAALIAASVRVAAPSFERALSV